MSPFWTAPSTPPPLPAPARRKGWRAALPADLFTSIALTASRVRRVEGPRGVAERTVVLKRRTAEFLGLMAAVAVTSTCFSGSRWAMGGTLMMVSQTALVVAAAIGTVFFPAQRNDITTELRRYLWGIVSLPGAGLAVFDRVLRGFLGNPTQGDMFAGLVSYSIPILFALTVLLPVPLFIKAVFGNNSLHRVTDDEEELMRLYTRQDGFQV